MGKLMFASRFSRNISKEIFKSGQLEINFDEVYLNCGKCKRPTIHTYIGVNGLENLFLEKVRFNYQCAVCKGIQSLKERK